MHRKLHPQWLSAILKYICSLDAMKLSLESLAWGLYYERVYSLTILKTALISPTFPLSSFFTVQWTINNVHIQLLLDPKGFSLYYFYEKIVENHKDCFDNLLKHNSKKT